jgi:DNA-directed RNA polymerase specialized sigma24 family protein
MRERPVTNHEHTADYAGVYAAHRGDLYRALVLITGNRDLAVDGVDHGFSRWQGRLRRRDADPLPQVVDAALRWIRRREGRHGGIQGFRLPGAPSPASADPTLERFTRLGSDDRALLTLRHFLRWEDGAIAAALRIEAGEVPARVAAAEARADTGDRSYAETLTRRAAAIPEPLDRMESSRRRGAAQRLLTALGLVVLVGAGTAGGILTVTALTRNEPAAEPPGTTLASGRLSIDPAEVTWAEVSLGILQGEVAAVTQGPAGFAALVHDYSRGQEQTVLLLSDDGLEWTGGAVPQPTGEGWVGYLAGTGDFYVTLGSRWAWAGGSEVPVVSTSTDGVTWDTVELPDDDTVEAGGMAIPLGTSVFGLVGDDTQLTVYGSQYAEFDVMSLVQQALPPEASLDMGWTVENGQLVLMGRDGSVTSRLSATDLGIDPQILSLMAGGRPVLWTSPDGKDWSREYPDVPTGEGFAQVASNPTARVAMIYGGFNPELWTGSDDTSWERADLPATALVAGVTTVNGHLVAYGSDGGGAQVWISDDGATWEPVGDDGWGGLIIDAFYGSAGGVVALAHGNPLAAAEPAVITVDGYVVAVHGNGRFVVTDPDGATVADVYDEDLVPRDDGALVIPDPVTGEPLVTLTSAEVEDARQQQLVGLVDGGVARDDTTVLVSADLEQWITVSLTDTIGSGLYPNSAAFDGTTVILSGWRDAGAFEETIASPSVWVADLRPN